MSRYNLSRIARLRARLLVLQCCVILLLWTSLSSAFRNNDQAAYVSGALQLAKGEASIWAAPFYNYDKQFATYDILAALCVLLPRMDPVKLSNVMNLVLFSFSALGLGLYRDGQRSIPWKVLIPMVLCPGLVLYAPFLGTSSVSYAILTCAFVVARLLPGRRGGVAASPLVALAVACRADAILAMPAFLLSLHSRQRFRDLAKDQTAWTLVVASCLPLLVGHLIFNGRVTLLGDSLGWSGQLKALAALIVFAFGLGGLLVLSLVIAGYMAIAAKKPQWRTYYAAMSIGLVIPFGFYSFQMSSPTYLFLEVAVTLFALLGRRSPVFWAHFSKVRADFAFTILRLSIVLTLIPWFVGLSLPRLTKPRLAMFSSTEFSTTHGAFPMGSYAAFLWRSRGMQFLIDHNQRIWESAEAVDYQTCNGAVPLAFSPMVNYLELAVRLQNKVPLVITNWRNVPSCGFVYVDNRSVSRERVLSLHPELYDLLYRGVEIASHDNDGQPILRIETRQPQSRAGKILSALREMFAGRQFEIEFITADTERLPLVPPREYAVFSDGARCDASPKGNFTAIPKGGGNGDLRLLWNGKLLDRPSSARISCPGAKFIDNAHTVLPDYMF